MALARLKRVLQTDYVVRLQSDQRLLKRVNANVNRRAQELKKKGQPSVPTKTPVAVPLVEAQAQWHIRAIDLLHKIGYLTTPSWVNMAQLSASWATRRYFWAIADGSGGQQKFRLSSDARLMDFHQKTLLSDEFGMGMAGLLVEQLFDAPCSIDVSVALDDPSLYQDIQQVGETQPDYLMWSQAPQSPYYVVECKGCQTNSSTSMNQLRRGLEQVPSLVFGAGDRNVVTLVVATCMEEDGTTVYVVDPPDDDPMGSDGPPKDGRDESVSERTGKRSWRIRNLEAFNKRTNVAMGSALLKWAGQFATAFERDARLISKEYDPLLSDQPLLPDLELEKKSIELRSYLGYSQPVFPELGYPQLTLFTGVEEELLAKVRKDSTAEVDESGAHSSRLKDSTFHPKSPYQSVSSGGTCMVIEGLA